jgi:hypothetical protein
MMPISARQTPARKILGLFTDTGKSCSKRQPNLFAENMANTAIILLFIRSYPLPEP